MIARWTIGLMVGFVMAGAACSDPAEDPPAQQDDPDAGDGEDHCPEGCAVGRYVCVGNEVFRCQQDRAGCTGFVALEDCASGTTCVDGLCVVSESGCVDQDGDEHGDGCINGADCDETDDTRYFGAEEVCDQVDNDCDGAVDDGNVCVSDCSDQECPPGLRECTPDGGLRECRRDESGCGRWSDPVDCGQGDCVDGTCSNWVDQDGDQRGENCAFGEDCDDADAERYPGATESCDGVDNDCDDQVDEDFEELGQECTLGIGACEAVGAWTCTDDGRSLDCSASPGQPGDEVCGDGVDNDCDSDTDEGFDAVGRPAPPATGNACAKGALSVTGPAHGAMPVRERGAWRSATSGTTTATARSTRTRSVTAAWKTSTRTMTPPAAPPR